MNINKHQANNQLRKNIGQFILKSRVNISLTGKEFGELINVSQQQISRYENGMSSISIDKLAEILDALNCSWSEFYYDVLITIENQYK